jgi:hypothetical protein
MMLEELVNRYPNVYYIAEVGSWPSIRRHGLLSTSALLDLFGYNGRARIAIERQHRPECVTIHHHLRGDATIRDQKPLNEIRLAACLTDSLTPSDWYMILNKRVFFWATYDRLQRLLKARAYRSRPHDVLVVDSRCLLESCGDSVELCHINSGATLMNAAKRGPKTFLPVQEYTHGEVAEIAVSGLVLNVEQITTRVLRMQEDSVLATVWERVGQSD